jgi:hypothetical protein
VSAQESAAAPRGGVADARGARARAALGEHARPNPDANHWGQPKTPRPRLLSTRSTAVAVRLFFDFGEQFFDTARGVVAGVVVEAEFGSAAKFEAGRDCAAEFTGGAR